MKLLQLSKYYPPTHGGLEIVAEFFSRAAADLGHETSILSLGEDTKVYSGRYGESVYQSKEDFKLKSAPLSFSYYKKWKDLITTADVIFVHLPNPQAHELIKMFQETIKARGCKVIGIYHSDIVNQVLLRDAYNLYFLKDINVYDGFMCSSDKLRLSSSIIGSLPESKVHVIPYCIDPLKSSSQSGKSSGKIKFMAIGRMVPYKGYDFLLKCFKDLPFELTMVGDGPLAEDLKKMAPPNVKFTGEVSEEEKFRLFNEHDALIVSSINRSEAYGMTIVEAFACGLPVIASDIDTGVTFLVRNEKTGLTFPILSQSGLTEQILRLAADEKLRKDLGRNCRQFFESTLSYSAFKNNLELYLSKL